MNRSEHHRGPANQARDLPRLRRDWTSFFLFLLQSSLWGITIFFLASHFGRGKFWLAVLSILLLSLPIFVCYLYSATIQQTKRLWGYCREGWYFRLWSGWFLKLVFSIALALCSAFFMLLQFHTYSPLEWTVFFAVIPLFWIIFVALEHFNSTELHPLLVTNTSLCWARWLCPLSMLLFFHLFQYAVVDIPPYESSLQAVYAQKDTVSDMTGSAFIFEVSQYLAWYNGVKIFALGHLGRQDSLWSLLITGMGSFIVFYNSCLSLSCFLIPRREYRRLFNPISDIEIPLPASPRQIAWSTGIFTFVILFIYVPIMAHLESGILQNPQVVEVRKQIEAGLIPRLEQIDDQFFKEGTIARIQTAKLKALHKADISLALLQEKIDLAFARMTWGVDDYLDWYYSLTGEYTRISKILTGDLEEYMMVRLETSLLQEDAFRKVEQALNQVFQLKAAGEQEYREAIGEIFAQNQVRQLPPERTVIRKMSMADALSVPVHKDSINLQNRMLFGAMGSAGTGILSGIVVKKICTKIVAKNTIKIAAKALSKIVLSKTTASAGGTTAGMAAGAAIGSLLPVVGTATGAVVGGVIGAVGAGITIDTMFLSLEEALSRNTFKEEILNSIEEARIEFKSQLST
ncbi:MAG: hypothetical protein KJ804_20815 [Proteobacteria bacterium]|nr:hypothetical protein [Pseudomonadota bacterium]MBU1060751.1 hypothetical protein [Pseudomonadota bacterium]